VMQRRGRTGRQCDGLYLRLVAQFGEPPPPLLPASLPCRDEAHEALFKVAHPAGRYAGDFTVSSPGHPVVEPLRSIMRDVVLEGGKKAAHDCIRKARDTVPDDALEAAADRVGSTIHRLYDDINFYRPSLLQWLNKQPLSHKNGATGDAVVLTHKGARVIVPGKLKVERPRFHCEARYGPVWRPSGGSKHYWTVQALTICTRGGDESLPPFAWLHKQVGAAGTDCRYNIKWSADHEQARLEVGQCIRLLTRGGTRYNFGCPATAPIDAGADCPCDLRSRFFWNGYQLYDSGWSCHNSESYWQW